MHAPQVNPSSTAPFEKNFKQYTPINATEQEAHVEHDQNHLAHQYQ